MAFWGGGEVKVFFIIIIISKKRNSLAQRLLCSLVRNRNESSRPDVEYLGLAICFSSSPIASLSFFFSFDEIFCWSFLPMEVFSLLWLRVRFFFSSSSRGITGSGRGV